MKIRVLPVAIVLSIIAFARADEKIEADPLYQSWLKEDFSLVTVNIVNTPKKIAGLYFFNHIHTNLSLDNEDLRAFKLSSERIFRIVEGFLRRREAKGVMVFTDHNTDKAYDQTQKIKSRFLSQLRSVEWGGATHMNLIGIKENWELLEKGRDFSGEQTVIKSRSSEGLRVINHPNRKGVFPFTSWLDSDGVEVWNTIMEERPYSKMIAEKSHNRDAFQQWHESLAAGKRYTALAGSDFHFVIPCLRDRVLFYPTNFIPAENLKDVDIKERLREGQVSFLTKPVAPKLSLQARLVDQKKWTSMGDELQGAGQVEVLLRADFSDIRKPMNSGCYKFFDFTARSFTSKKRKTWELRFYNKQDQLIAKAPISAAQYNKKNHFEARLELKFQEESDLIRAELWSINKELQQVDLLAATNPIYISIFE